MSSGVRFDGQIDGRPGDEAVFRRLLWSPEGPGAVGSVMPFNERVRSAGEKFVYASPETQVLALVLRSAVNRSLAEYLSEKIWQPMGAEADATWNIDATGHETGPSGVNATLRDWGRFGLLLANDGMRDGRQIIPAAWVRAATSPDAPHLKAGTATRGLGYGYQTWILNEQFRHFALLGAVLVAPFLKLVVVHTAVDAKESDTAALTERIRFFNSIIKKPDVNMSCFEVDL
jgi:CubicO group peptidase (beta-lactamase class C family)